jgi:hypothetical protein
MVNSQQSVLALIQQKHPEIPHVLYRWSCSLFYIYIARKSSVSGKYLESWLCLYKALKLDFSMTLLRPDLYVQTLKIILISFIRIVSLVFPRTQEFFMTNKNNHPQQLQIKNGKRLMKIKKILPSKIYEDWRINWLSQKVAIQKYRVTV